MQAQDFKLIEKKFDRLGESLLSMSKLVQDMWEELEAFGRPYELDYPDMTPFEEAAQRDVIDAIGEAQCRITDIQSVLLDTAAYLDHEWMGEWLL